MSTDLCGFFQRDVVLWSAVAALLAAAGGSLLTRRLKEIPGRAQAAAELLAERLSLACGAGASGPSPSVCVSIVGSVVLFAISCNIVGLVMLAASRGRSLLELSMVLALASCAMVMAKRFVATLFERPAGSTSLRGRLAPAVRAAASAGLGLLTGTAGGVLLAVVAGWGLACALPLSPVPLGGFAGPIVAAGEVAVVLAARASGPRPRTGARQEA